MNKIKNYEDYNKKSFPKYSQVSIPDIRLIVDALRTFLGVKRGSNNQSLFETIRNSDLVHRRTVQNTDEILPILEGIDFSTDGIIYILWNDVDEVDKMDAKELISIWSDIWYPDADEAVILFCATKMKFIMITDWREIFYN